MKTAGSDEPPEDECMSFEYLVTSIRLSSLSLEVQALRNVLAKMQRLGPRKPRKLVKRKAG